MTPIESMQQDALLAIKAMLTQPYDGPNLPSDIVAIISTTLALSKGEHILPVKQPPSGFEVPSFRAKAGWRFRDKGMTNHEWTEEDWKDWYQHIGQALYKIAERKHGNPSPVEHAIAEVRVDPDPHQALIEHHAEQDA